MQAIDVLLLIVPPPRSLFWNVKPHFLLLGHLVLWTMPIVLPLALTVALNLTSSFVMPVNRPGAGW